MKQKPTPKATPVPAIIPSVYGPNTVAPSILPPLKQKASTEIAQLAHEYRTWHAQTAAYGEISARTHRLKLDELFAKYGV